MTVLVARRARPAFVASVLCLSLVHAAAAHIAVPFWPVPATLQPLSVLLIAGLAAPRVALGAYVAYLLEGAVGLPVFAHGGGIAYLAGPTAGYLAGQLVATFLVSRLLASGVRPVMVPVVMCLGIAAMYLPGALWLSGFVGTARAWQAGVVPFVPADVVKAGIASAAVLLRRS